MCKGILNIYRVINKDIDLDYYNSDAWLFPVLFSIASLAGGMAVSGVSERGSV